MQDRSLARLNGIESLRAFAASFVIILHATAMLPVPVPAWFADYRTFMTLGVPLFFSISAFSMAYAYEHRLDTMKDMKTYLARRFFRIAPLFYFFLAAWTICYLYYGSPLKSPTEYILNMTFLFGLLPNMNVSIVPAGWSIGVEMLFYVVFPVIIIYLKTIPKSVVGLCLALLVAREYGKQTYEPSDGIQMYFWTNVLTNFPYFMYGLLGYRTFRFLQDKPYMPTAAKALMYSGLVVGLGMLFFGPSVTVVFSNKSVPTFFLIGWGYALSAVVVAQALRPGPLFDNPVSLYMGKISFSLYLVHPLIIFATPVITNIGKMDINDNIKLILYCGYGLASSAAAASILYKVIEAPAQDFGRRLTKAM